MDQIDVSEYVEAEGLSLRFADEKQQANFELGVSMCVHSWSALETAVANNWGGAQSEAKREWMTAIVVELFNEKIVDVQLIEETLLNAMLDEFDVNVEDDSSLPVSARVLKVYKQCARGDFSEVRAMYDKWQAKAAERELRRRQLQVDLAEDDSSDEESGEDEQLQQAAQPAQQDVDMDVDMEESGPVVDDDGFELVQRKGRRR